ncbi:MAG: hypothetical protein ACLP00_01795, partial [Terracidiphilus sp.]
IARGVFPTVGSFAHRAARAGMKTKPQMVHNLKAVYVRPAAMNGVNEFVVMKQTGHRSAYRGLIDNDIHRLVRTTATNRPIL